MSDRIEEGEAAATRLNKYIAETGFCSRREADRIIAARRVTVNGLPAGMGAVVGEGDDDGGAPRKFKPAGARTGKPSGFKPGPPGKLHRKGPPKPRE